MTATRPAGVDERDSAAVRRGRASRVKGRTFAGLVRRWLEEHVGPVIVPQQEASADDMILIEQRLSVECKNQKAMSLAAWVDQADRQAKARGGLVPVVVHKRAGKGDPADWYVTIRLGDLPELLNRRPR